MFDHVTIRVSDRDASLRFYTAVLDVLGFANSGGDVLPEWEDFSLAAAEDPSRVTQGLHIGFAAHSRPEVDAFWRAGIAVGAPDDGAPGPRPSTATTTTARSCSTPTATAPRPPITAPAATTV